MRAVRWRSPRIEVRDLRVLGVHGVLPEERQRAQPFSVDIDAWVDLPAGVGSDVIGDTVDYGELVERAASVVASSSFQLIETLAGAVASSLLGTDRRVVAVAVTVRKLRPPLPHHVGSVGVRVVRRRDPDRGADADPG
ncbi:MAG: dihydroneopterin aldolase [Acidimicrobiales bacterium]